ncbi:phage tail tip fiber protein [Klebsiella pneumoniae]|uniref:phage tail tip fiber protein n=3 Tax=Enterobacteriaceae TaxID=543 RepID=UPI001D0D7774|nr:phage tail protein [Klebsiella pneumoniae]
MEQFKKRKLPEIIAGAGGKKSSGSSRTPVEADDTVNSNVKVSILDLLGEGVIGGLKDGAKSIFLNDLPLQNSDDTYNHSGVTWWFRDGSQDQSIIEGFDYTETPKTIGLQVKKTNAVTMAVDSDSADRFRVILKFPSLKSVDKKTGDTSGTSVTYKFQVSSAGGAFVDVAPEGESSGTVTLTAKKAGVYYRSYILNLPKPGSKYQVRVVRVTDDNKDTTYLANDIYVDTVGEIINTNMNYPNSALVGLRVNSEQFGSSMPSRSYLISGMKIRVPSNYDEVTNEYRGTWDGSFKLLSSSNPAWILYDLVTNKRYGLGEFVRESMFDLGQLYQIGRYCDALVDDGFGGKEKRFAINTQITTLQDAYRCVQDIAGAFRGMVYWAGGMVHVTQDSPSDPIAIYSNSNVIDGRFSYKGSARKDRPSVALITYNNKEDNYKQNIEYVEDLEAIKRYGIRKTESVAFGCTSRGMAHRVGLWTLYTGRMESDVITFQTGMDSAFLVPGDVILIHDKFRAGRRNSGRVVASTANSITLDAKVDMTKAGTITFINAEGRMISRDILESGVVSKVTFKDAVNEADRPVADGIWVISQSDLKPLQARVVGVTQGEDGVGSTITCIQNNPSKYAAIDDGAVLIPQNTTVLDPTFSKPENLKITEGTYLSSPGNLNVSLTATWEGKSAEYWVSWRRSDAGNVSNWQTAKVNEEQFEVKPVAESGKYDFQVYGVSVSGRKTEILSTTYQVLGTMTPPGAPSSLTAVGDYRQIILGWSNPSSVDLDHIQIYASKTNDVTKATLLAKSTTTNFTHSGLEDSVTWYYWIRSANKRGMTSDWSSKLGTSAMTRDVLSFLQNKITESELAKDLLADIDSKAVAAEVDASIEDAKSEATAQVEAAKKEASSALSAAQTTLNNAIKQEATDRNNAVADEAKQRSQAISAEADARTKAISDEAIARADAITKESDTRTRAMADEVTARNKAVADEAAARTKAVSDEAVARAKAVSDEVAARTKAVADEAAARAKAISDEAAARATAISDSVAVEATARAKAIADSASSLSDKIEKEVTDRVKAVSDLDTKTANAISSESSSRIAAISDEAKTRADAILQEKNSRQAEIKNVSAQMQTANESLAQQISQVAAGTGEQFDSLKIWYFDAQTTEGWSGNKSAILSADGWIRSGNGGDTWLTSPAGLAIAGASYRFMKMRIRKVGNPVWEGAIRWITKSGDTFNNTNFITVSEPEYNAQGVATLTASDIKWNNDTIHQIRLDLSISTDDSNYIEIDWIAVGRPTPGAGMAALQDEKTARTNADAAEAASRSTLATQLRGSYDGTDITKLSSGLIFQEQQARVTADKVEATARQSLETKVNDSVSSINKSLDTLNTKDQAMASDITGLKSSLDDKADASAVQTLKATVEQQGSNISTQGQSITKLQGDLNTTNTNVGKKADQTAMTALQGTVTQQGKDIAAANSSISTLKSSLDTTNDAVAKKADATAVSDLSSRVSATEGSVSSQGDSIVQLNNSLSNALADSDASAKTPNNLIVNPSFERGLDGYIGQLAAASVVETSTPYGGTRALKVDVGYVSPGQYVSFVQGRTYEIGVWVKDLGATTDNGAGNNKLRIGNSAGQPVFERPYNSGTIGSDWTLISGRWKATETAKLPVTLSNGLTAGSRCFDDFYVIDVTDSVKIDANASALSSLQNTVTQQGKDIASQSTSITSLSNQMVNGRQNMWVRSVYSVQLANSTTEPTFSDINGKAPISIDEVPDAAKLDFASAGSYVIAHYKAFVKVNADTTITMAPGSRVFDDTGAVYVNGVRVAFGNAGWNTVSFDLKAGWSTVEFLVNQWTGQAYINLGFKLSEKVAQLNSALGMNALSNAISAVTSNVSTVGDRVTSTTQSVTDLRNSLEQTNANLANKADAQALSTLQNTVTQQGKDIVSASSSIASLQNNLSTTNANVAKKADATALNALQNTVTSQGDALTSQGNRVTSLENTLTVGDNIVPNSAMLNNAQGWRGHATTVDGYPAVIDTAAWSPASPNFSVTPGDILDFSLLCLAGAAINGLAWGIRFDGPSLTNNSVYVEALNYAAGEKKAVTGTITVPAGATTGYLQPYSRNAITLTIYNIKVTRRNAGTIANAKAITDLTNEVTQQGKDITSASSDISLLKNSLATTDANVAKKADSSALSSLQSTVTQQGKDLSSVGNRATALENSLKTTNDNVATKADASALSTLQNTVSQHGDSIASQSDSITSLKNSVGSLVNMGDNLVQDSSFDNGGQTFRTQQNSGTSGSIVAFGAFGENSAGVRMVKVNGTSPGLFANGKLPVPVNGARKYRYIVRAKGVSGAMNMLLRRWNFNGNTEGAYEDKNNTLTTDWQTITWDTSFSPKDGVDGQSFGIYCHPNNGEIWIDSFQVFDITDATNNETTASALSNLSTTVSRQGETVTSQGTAITKLQNDLSSTKTDLAKKADASALQTLQSTVTDQGKTLTSQGDAITALNNTVNTVKGDVAKKADSSALQNLQSTVTQQGKDISTNASNITALTGNLATTNAAVATKADASALNNLTTRVTQNEKNISSQSDAVTKLSNTVSNIAVGSANLIPNSGTMEGWSDVISDTYRGNKVFSFTRKANSSSYVQSNEIVLAGPVDSDSYVYSFWAKAAKDGTVINAYFYNPSNTTGSETSQGVKGSSSDGSAAITLTTSWARYWVKWTHSPTTGTKRFIPARLNNSSTADQTVFISSPQLETGNVVTDWKAADSDFASASALSTLTSRVTSDEGVISSQGSAIADLKNSLATTNSTVATKADASALSSLQNTVTKQGTDLKSASDSITTLKNSIAATDANVAKKADASALQTLQSTVSTQGDKIASQGNSITSLGNSLDTVKGDVAKKADTTALNNLSTRVSNAEDKISSSSDAITSLNSSLNQQSKRGANILPDGTFESYSSGYNITNGRVIVTADDSHGGNKCIRVTRPNDYTNYTDNSDNHIFSGFQVRDNAVFYVECWVKLDAKSTTMDGSVQIAVGMSLQYQDNSWQWPALIKSAKDLSADTWTKVSGYLKSSKSGIKQAMVRISIPNVSTVKAGNSFLVDDFVITDVTDAYNAQQTADATASAVSTLQTTVSRQGDSITSQGDSITTLNNGLATANKAIGTKADASALSSLQNTVTQQGEDVAANTNNITALSNQVVNGKQDTWARRIYKCQLANAGTEPTFSDIQGLSPVFMDEVADAARMDFSGAGSYVVAHYKAMVRVAADTTISVSPGSRVFDDSGAVYVNGVRQAAALSGTAVLNFTLSAGWNTVEFLVNQWTGNAYVNLGFKLGDKVAELYSGLGVSSLSSALNSISSNVSKVGDQVSSNSTAITSLKNGLSDTNSTVAKKADASALQTLQNTVTQQGKDIASQSDSVTNLSNALSNVSIGGVNLIKNSGDMAGWSGKTNEIFRGNAVISATTKAGSSYRVLKEITLDAPVDNAEYVYSFFAKGGENGQSMTAYFYNPNSTTSGVSSQGVSDGSVDGRMSFTLTTEWVRYWVKWKQKPGTGSKRIILARIQASSTKDQTVSITSPKLEVGNMPTEWSPAPSDMASSNDLSSLKTTVDANSSSIQSVTSRVQKTEDSISTQNTAITKLQGDLSSTNNLVSTKADSTALQTLSGRVDKTESSISTQNDAITKLNSSLDTTNKAVAKKAEQSSLDTLSGRVSSTENGITAANSSITSLNAAIRAENASSGDLITNPTFDPQYAQMGFTVVSADTDGVPANCPFRYAAKLAARDHHPNFNTIVATLGDVFEISALVACGAGNADFNLYIGTANGPTGGVGGPLYNGGNTKATSTWTRVTWKFTVSQAMVDKGYIRPFLQINQSSPFGTIWYVTDWHMRNITAASKAQDTANATSKAVDSLTSTVNQQGSDISSIGSRTTSLENGLSTTNANVAKKADSSALQTLQNSVTQQGNDISGQGSRVTSLENNLTAGANLIPNPAMLNGAQGWVGSATTVDGYAAVVSSSGWSPSSSYFQVTPGDIIDLSLMSQSEGAASISWGLRFDGPGLSNFCLYAPALTFAAGEKKSVSAAITVPAGATKAMFQASARATSARTVYNIIATRRDAGTKANSSAIDTLNSTVKTQGDTLSSIGSRTTSLENGLSSANSALSLKADASALSSLTNTVTQQGKDLDAAEANIIAANTSITSMQASLTRRTVFTVTAKGNGNSANHGLFDESGKSLFTPGRSYALITFKANSDGSTVINTSKTYDVFGSANNGKAMSDDIAALANGVYVCVMTYDEPSGQRNSIASALELLGGTTEVINSLPYRGAYILLGRKGMKAGDGLELRAPTGGDSSAFISTSVEFVNGVMMGLGAAGGVMMKADANASAITTLQNTVKQQGDTIASSSSAITSLQNDMRTVNDNVSKKADASALQTLQNTVTQQGKDISTQSASLTQLNNSLIATNASIDASGKIPGNLIVNSSFEREKDGYTGWSSIASVIAASVPHSGSKILKLAAGGSVLVGQDVTYLKGRTYKIGAWAKQDSGTVIQAADNTKFRIADSTGLLASSVYGPFTSNWQEISFTWRPGKDVTAATQITAYLSAGAMYFDDFYVIDITDRVDLDATVSAVSGLTTRVSNAEGNISSQSDSITTLNNGLSTLNKTVSTKADATALSSLQNTVTQQGKDISSASGSITSLQSSLNTIKVQSNPWIDGTFETYDNNQQLGGSTAIVTTDFKNSGNKCLKVTRPANTSGNSDKTIGSYSAVRQSAKYRVEFWAMMPASEAPPSGWTVVVGLHSINKDGGNDWQGIAFDEAGLGGRDQWVKFTGVVKVSPSVTRSHVWISTRGQSGSNTPGYAVYIDDFVITDITDAADAQATADANATAISSLQTKVSDIDGKVTAQTSQLSSMQSKVDASSSKVDQLSKTISDSQSTQASLNTSLQSQIDAQASANIKNQADLNSAATSIATIKSTQSTQATQLSAIAKQQTDMTASLDNQSASIQTLQESVANNDSLKSTWMVKMETNSAGQKYAAGIALGVDGKSQQSQFLVQADRFALINTSNGNTTTPFVIDNGVTYMNAAYIKDGAITNAKIGGEIRSDNFVDGSQGWRVGKDGSSQFHNVVVRGHVEANSGSFRGAVYATDGWFQGTVYANRIEGDIGSFAINIAQHRTRKVPKATWQWFELARFRRQSFDQVINIRGGLLQTDSVTIDGGAKLRAGMSYAPGADGGLNPGYLSYAMLLRGTGATSGGGSMEIGIELMYETGGWDRLLTAQGEMNVDNMSFVVPAGSGDAVLRYGCYLDRNGQMVLTILSRFDAFSARNNNVIRGSSTP